MLKTIMDHLVAMDVLLGDQAAMPLVAGGSHSNMAANVFYFTSRVVDKLIQGTYTGESKEVFDFICKLLAQAKRKCKIRNKSLLHVRTYHCLCWNLIKYYIIFFSHQLCLELLKVS